MKAIASIVPPEKTKVFKAIPGDQIRIKPHGTQGKVYAVSFGFGGFVEYRVVWWFGGLVM